MAEPYTASAFRGPNDLGVIINAVAVNTNSANIDPGNYYRSLTFELSGAFIGYATVEQRIGSAWYACDQIYNARGQQLQRAIRPGIYRVPCDGPKLFRIRVFPLYGSMTVEARLSMADLPPKTKGHAVIAGVYQQVIAEAGNATVMSAIPVSIYSFLLPRFIVDDETSAFDTRVEIAGTIDRNLDAASFLGAVNGNPDDWKPVYSASIGRGSGELFELPNIWDTVTCKIFNDGPGSHTYDFWLSGRPD